MGTTVNGGRQGPSRCLSDSRGTAAECWHAVLRAREVWQGTLQEVLKEGGGTWPVLASVLPAKRQANEPLPWEGDSSGASSQQLATKNFEYVFIRVLRLSYLLNKFWHLQTSNAPIAPLLASSPSSIQPGSLITSEAPFPFLLNICT
jgi:hypothetical protein